MWTYCLLHFFFLSGQIVTVKEGEDAALSCSPYGNSNIESKPFNWTKEETDSRKLVFLHNTGSNDRIGQDKEFQGRVSHFSDKLTQGQAYITIKNVKLTDNGKYTCNFPDRTTEILLHVGECCHETFDYSVVKLVMLSSPQFPRHCSHCTNSVFLVNKSESVLSINMRCQECLD